MAQSKMLCSALLLLLAMLALHGGGHGVSCTAELHHRNQAARLQHVRHVKSMVFYMHDVAKGPRPTAVIVAAQDGKLEPPLKLGTTVIFDDKLTAGPDPSSMAVGRGQGLYAQASLTSLDLLLTFTAVLHHPAIYNGSTISLHGSDRILLPEREISVVGGTGVFRFVRGYAVLSTVAADRPNAIIKFNLTLLLE